MKFTKLMATLGAALVVAFTLIAPSAALAAPTTSSATSSADIASVAGPISAASSAVHITVPSRYVYNPNTTYQRTLHDYCTASPDSWGDANFRGSCARHDLCIMDRQIARSTCDSNLLSNLKSECRYAYASWYEAAAKAECLGVAYVYYGAVRAKTYIS